MSAPNTVTITNNSGNNWTAAAILHCAGTPVVLPFTPNDSFDTGEVNSPGGTFSGVVQVDSAEDDYWLFAMLFTTDSQDAFVMPDSLGLKPYKECGAPENGTTSIVVNPSTDGGATYPVSIITYEQDGSIDSECSATMEPYVKVVEDMGEFDTELLDLLLEGV